MNQNIFCFVSSVSQKFHLGLLDSTCKTSTIQRENYLLLDFITWIGHINFAWRNIDQICKTLKIPDLLVILKKKEVNYIKKNVGFICYQSSKQRDLYDETFSQLVDSVLEGYNGELTIIITCKRKQTKHTLFQQAMYILGHFFYISSPSGDMTAILCGHLRQIIV